MHIEEIADLLLALPDLVGQQELRSPDFTPNAAAWLNSLESVFAACRLHQAGSIAMLRSELVAAEQGHVPPGLEFRGRPGRSRVLSAMAARALQRAAEVASLVIAENQPRLTEAERVARQIVAVAHSNGLTPVAGKETSNTETLRLFRQQLGASHDLETAIVHLEGLVGPHDALVFLDRARVPYVDLN